MNDSLKQVPELRFKGFSDYWKHHKLGDIVKKQIKGTAQLNKLHVGDVEYLDASRLNGGSPFFTNGIRNVEEDDILILWDGSKAGTVYTGFSGTLGSTLKAYQTILSSDFVYQFLKRQQENIYEQYRTPNIPHVQKDFLNVFNINIPSSAEQQKIGGFFKQLDETITLHQRKLDKLKELKEGYLQKMFPQNGQKIPELRFKGFADPWEQRRLQEVVDVKGGKDYKSLGNGPIPVYGTGGYMLSVDTALSDTKDAVGIGRKGTIDKPYILRAPFWTVDTLFYAVPKGRNNLRFVFGLFERINWKRLDESTGVPSLSKSAINSVSIFKPCMDEQTKIGYFLTGVDHLITLHQRKLEKLKELKKGYLQKMFC